MICIPFKQNVQTVPDARLHFVLVTMATAIAQILNENSNYLYWGSHATEVADNLVSLQQAGSMVDVTLTAGGEAIKVHRMVLCASSPFLQQILSNLDDPTPNIILPETEMKDLKGVIDFVYKGEINFQIPQLPSLLKVAEILGVHGLSEINSEIPQLHPQPEETAILPVVEDSEPSETISLTLWESDLGTEDEDASVAIAEEVVDEKSKSDNTEPNRKKRRKMCSELSAREKKYSDETLEDALKEMKAGRNLCDVADSFGIPRSSLYMKARSSGVISPSNKVTYSNEQLQEAIEAVKDGMSLQQAALRFSIPKTVLWRRVQAFRGEYSLRCHQNYSAEDRQAAVEALQRGETLHVVSEQFAVPKTTLFREKVKLVEKGVLPSCSVRRRSTDAEFIRNLRVEQAVAACKDGKMSQAAASLHFQVPKTTIWRHLQGITPKSRKQSGNVGQLKQAVVLQDPEASSVSVNPVLEVQETYGVDASNIKFDTEDGEFATSSLIILSAVEGGSHLIVSSETGELHQAEEEDLHTMDDEKGD